VGLAPVEDLLGRHRADAGQSVELLERRGIQMDGARSGGRGGAGGGRVGGDDRLPSWHDDLKTVLDGADGALARASGRITAFGRYLDSECDLLVNAALFAAIGYASGRWFLAASLFLASTIVLSVNYNLRRLYLRARGIEEAQLPVTGRATRAARRFHELVYAPQDRAVEWFIRLYRITYGTRALTVLHNLGLATQHTAIAACLVLAAQL
jgi:hypothetical protein